MQYPIHKLENEDDGLIDDEDIEEEASRFLHARDGDHLMCPFQCDLCHFRNIQKRDPGPDPRDAYAMMAIRRATLDSFWARESSTVLANQREQKHDIKASEAYGMSCNRRSQPAEPYRVEDDWGMYEAIALLHRSLDKGRNKPTVQFSTMRKLRAFFSNVFHTGNASTGMSSLAGAHGSQFFTESPTYGFWFKRFIEGCHRRMGDHVLSDRALTIDELLVIQVLMEEDWTEMEEEGNREDQLHLAMFAVVLTIGFSGAFRGEEIPKFDLGTTREHLEESMLHPRHPHVTIALKGRVKGETRTRCHLLPVAMKTESGIENAKWLQRLVDLYERKGIVKGPLMRTLKNGKLVKSRITDHDPRYHDFLRRVQMRAPEVLNPKVKVEDEASLFCSGRKGSVAQARNMRIPKEVIDSNNRWRKVERAGGRQITVGMMEHYSDVRAMIKALLEYSSRL